MSKNLTIRAWKDATFRASLGEAQMAKLPKNPAGDRDLKAAEIASPTVRGAGLPSLTGVLTVYYWCCAD